MSRIPYTVILYLIHSFPIISFCLKKSGFIINPTVAGNAVNYYGSRLNFQGMDFQTWYQKMTTHYYFQTFLPAQSVVLDGKTFSSVVYVQSLGYLNDSNGAVIVLLNNDEIQKMLKGLQPSGGWAYIEDANGHIISSVSTNPGTNIHVVDHDSTQLSASFERKIENAEMMVTYTTSNYNRWRYVIVQPVSIVKEKVNTVRAWIMIYVLLSLFVGLCVSLLLSYTNSRRIKRIIEILMAKMGSPYPSGDFLRFIQDGLSTEILAGGYDFFAVNDKFTFNELKDYLQKTCYGICEYFNARVALRDKKLEDDIIAYIYQNYNLDLSLDFIAAKFNMNPKYLSRFFKEHFGVNFLEFINQFRVKKAKQLLVQEPNLKINAIADQVGISNVNTFIAVFKKYEGVTPGKYRNMQNSNVG